MREDRLAGFCQKNNAPWATARKKVKTKTAAAGQMRKDKKEGRLSPPPKTFMASAPRRR